SASLSASIPRHPTPHNYRTDSLLMTSANPLETNGSHATAPDWPGRLEAIIERGGRFVVVDPRRTKTADAASEHVAIRPGTDAHLLMAMAHVLFAENLVDLGAAAEYVVGVNEVEQVAKEFPPEAV